MDRIQGERVMAAASEERVCCHPVQEFQECAVIIRNGPEPSCVVDVLEISLLTKSTVKLGRAA
jgi:hypothetical protein